VRHTRRQSMACQVVVSPGAAPASVAAADMSACLPKSVSRSSLVTEDLREVSPWARGRVMSLGNSTQLNPCPSGYRTAFACSLILYPPSPGLALRFAVPRDPEGSRGETTGLPRSVLVAVWVRSRLFAGGAASAPGDLITPGLDHVPFWPKRVSILRLLDMTTFTSASRKLTVPHVPGARLR